MTVTVSVAVSLDGCIDDRAPGRLMLSSPEDWQEVYRLRSECDAVLVGAGTLRKDDPSLVIKDPALRAERARRGRPEDILRVSLSESGKLDTTLKFFTGPGRPLLFLGRNASQFEGLADVVVMPEFTPAAIIAELERRGVQRLMVEGGQEVLAMFFGAGAVDELRLAVAPFMVGDPEAPRFMGRGKTGRMALLRVEKLGDMAVMHYAADPDRSYMRMAIEESRKCTPSQAAYCVGAVVVLPDGRYYTGYTHETSPVNHAEEEAIAKALAGGASLQGAVMYSSMEPCSERKSKPESCSRLIIRHGFRRAVFALREPSHFVDCHGAEILAGAGVEITEMPEMGVQVERINAHLLK